MKLKNILLYLLPIAGLCSSCNDEWENEQFTHYISFKAPINSDGVSRINVRYRSGNEKTTFQLPIIVSGSTTNERNITVHVGLDTDTLKVLNQERFNNRTDLYYQVLPKKFYSHSETVQINAGQDVALMPIDFSMEGIDLSDKWVLPLTIEESPDGNYTPNYRKHYRKALLRVMPFNDYSGNYSAVNYKTYLNGSETDAPYVKNYVMMYVTMKRYSSMQVYLMKLVKTGKDIGLKQNSTIMEWLRFLRQTPIIKCSLRSVKMILIMRSLLLTVSLSQWMLSVLT